MPKAKDFLEDANSARKYTDLFHLLFESHPAALGTCYECKRLKRGTDEAKHLEDHLITLTQL